MSWILITLSILVALTLLALEIIAIPGITIFGIGGFVLLVYTIYITFALHGVVAGMITLFGSLILGSLMFIFLMRSKMWERFKLKKEIKGRVNETADLLLQVGDRGITLSRLAPRGMVLFGNESVEVYALCELIDPKTPVEICHIDGNKIGVKRITE